MGWAGEGRMMMCLTRVSVLCAAMPPDSKKRKEADKPIHKEKDKGKKEKEKEKDKKEKKRKHKE